MKKLRELFILFICKFHLAINCCFEYYLFGFSRYLNGFIRILLDLNNYSNLIIDRFVQSYYVNNYDLLYEV
jgi:hypothetical protein